MQSGTRQTKFDKSFSILTQRERESIFTRRHHFDRSV